MHVRHRIERDRALTAAAAEPARSVQGEDGMDDVHPVVSVPERPEHVEDNIKGSLLTLPPSSLKTLNDAGETYTTEVIRMEDFERYWPGLLIVIGIYLLYTRLNPGSDRRGSEARR